MEVEVNEKIKEYFEDVALLRRELVNFRYLEKNSYTSEYKVIKRKLYKEDMEKNSLPKQHAHGLL